MLMGFLILTQPKLFSTQQSSYNVALNDNGGTCNGSSTAYSSDHLCQYAIDGQHQQGAQKMWMTVDNDPDPWIMIVFNTSYIIDRTRILQNYNHIAPHTLFKDVLLTFSDNSTQTITLQNKWYNRYLWEDFALTPVNTNYVRVEGETAYSSSEKYVIIEVEFYTAVDECNLGNNDCHHDATCVDIATGLGYRCPCKTGYYGDGRITGSGCVARNGSVNVAALDMGGSCTGSSSERSTDYICSHALDSVQSHGAGTTWMMRIEDPAPWIAISFIQTYHIHLARFLQVIHTFRLFKDLQLTFSDSSIQNVTLSIALHQFDRHLWEEFELTPVNTSSVRIEALTWYTYEYNGFVEVEFYTVSNECDEGIHDCHPDAACVDITYTPGYLCPCNTGFYGDGKINGFGCQALDHSVNVALVTHGGACDSSSSEVSTSWFCSNAINGIHVRGTGNLWYSHPNDQDSWMSVTFNEVHIIDRLKILPDKYHDRVFKTLMLKFDNGSHQNITLRYR